MTSVFKTNAGCEELFSNKLEMGWKNKGLWVIEVIDV
jgi:hypothetical protein